MCVKCLLGIVLLLLFTINKIISNNEELTKKKKKNETNKRIEFTSSTSNRLMNSFKLNLLYPSSTDFSLLTLQF